MVRWLIDKGEDPMQRTSSGKLPIHIAASSCSESLGVLIDAECDVNIKDVVHGETPLHYACNSCCKETILVLIQAGAAFYLVNKRGETPLHKLLRFAIDFHDFHSKLRKDTAKKLIAIGFRILPLQSSNKTHMRKGRDKIHNIEDITGDSTDIAEHCTCRVTRNHVMPLIRKEFGIVRYSKAFEI